MSTSVVEPGTADRGSEASGSTGTIVWEETISRGITLALMRMFTSAATALEELVDNPIDYREGQQLAVDVFVDEKGDKIVVESDGGRGMDAEGVNVWLNWGEGEVHTEGHIGRYHQGGKAACGFLGQHVRMWAKRRGSPDIWFLEDDAWANRKELKSFGTPSPLPRDSYPPTMKAIPLDRGHVRIEISKLNKDRRKNLEVLRRALASTYRHLLLRSDLSIAVSKEPVLPLDIPLSTATAKIQIDVKLGGGRSVSGWAGRMKRDQVTAPLKSGLRLLHNGRLIHEGEWFGYNHEGKGALNTLIGELHLKGFQPVPNKTDFVERGDQVWDQLGREALNQLSPLISELRKPGQEALVTKHEKQRAREVSEELGRVFAAMQGVGGVGESGEATPEMSAAPAGRKPPADREGGDERRTERQSAGRGPDRNPRQPRTAPPEGAIGDLARLVARATGGADCPPLRIIAWNATERSTWSPEGPNLRRWLDINKNFPLYREFEGSKAYLAETAIQEICRPAEGDVMSAAQYLDSVNLLLYRWAKEAGLVDGADEPS